VYRSESRKLGLVCSSNGFWLSVFGLVSNMLDRQVREEPMSSRQVKVMLCVVLGRPKDGLSTELAHDVG